MIAFFANIFGYLLNFLYNIFENYGIALIVFSVIIKILLIPVSIKQTKAMRKNNKVQQELKQELKSLQVKYKDNPEQLYRETMQVYKRNNTSQFNGCSSIIIQIILVIVVVCLIRNPLTYMKKIDADTIEKYRQELNIENNKNSYPEIKIIQAKGNEDNNVYINMNFFGLDLSDIPTQNASDWKVFIIPALYVISSIISMKKTTEMQTNSSKEINTGKDGEQEEDQMEMINKYMIYIMPIMFVPIIIIYPLGLALYWLVNNVLMIIERFTLNKFIKDEEE